MMVCMYASWLVAALPLLWAGAAFAADLRLPVRSRVEAFKGSGVWEEVRLEEALPVSQTAILICDMWDKHWCPTTMRADLRGHSCANQSIAS